MKIHLVRLSVLFFASVISGSSTLTHSIPGAAALKILPVPEPKVNRQGIQGRHPWNAAEIAPFGGVR